MSLPTLESSILDHISFTPVCLLCKLCGKTFGTRKPDSKQVKRHFKRHFTLPTRLEQGLTKKLQSGVDSALCTNNPSLLEQSKKMRDFWKCECCGIIKDRKNRFDNKCVENNKFVPVKQIQLECGRWCPVESLNLIQKLSSINFTTDNGKLNVFNTGKEVLSETVTPLIMENEELGMWPEILQTILTSVDDIEEYVLNYLEYISQENEKIDGGAKEIVNFGNYYFDRIELIINSIPRNVLAELAKFKTTDGEDSVWCFTARRSYEQVKEVFRDLVFFLNSIKSPYIISLIVMKTHMPLAKFYAKFPSHLWQGDFFLWQGDFFCGRGTFFMY